MDGAELEPISMVPDCLSEVVLRCSTLIYTNLKVNTTLRLRSYLPTVLCKELSPSLVHMAFDRLQDLYGSS